MGIKLRPHSNTVIYIKIYKCLFAHSALTTATATIAFTPSLATFPSLGDSLPRSFGSQLEPCLIGPTTKAVAAAAAQTAEDAVELAVAAAAAEEAEEEDAASSGGGTPSGEPSA